MAAINVAIAETIMAIHANRRVTFLSITSSVLLLLSTTAPSDAKLSNGENSGQFLPLSFWKTAFSISAVFLIPILSESHFPWKHFTKLILWSNFCSNLEKAYLLRYSKGSGFSSRPSRPIEKRLRRWQSRHPFLFCIRYFLPFFAGLAVGSASGWAFGLTTKQLFSPKVFESSNNDGRVTTNNRSDRRASITRFCKINTSQSTKNSEGNRKHLPHHWDYKVGKRDSSFRKNICRVMGLRHLHYPFRKGRIGIFIFFKRFWIRYWACEDFTMNFLMCNNARLIFLRSLVCHKLSSNAFAYFAAGHLKTLLLPPVWNHRSAGMTLRRLPRLNLDAGSLYKTLEPGKAALQSSCLLQNHSYNQFNSFNRNFQVYFLLFLLFLSGSSSFFFGRPFFAGLGGSGLALGGRPFPGTFRIASRADLSYKASLVMGMIPALKRRMLTVLTGTPKSSAISVMVYPSIFILSDYITKTLKNIVHKPQLPFVCIVVFQKICKKVVQKPLFSLIKCYFCTTINNRGWKQPLLAGCT